MARILFDSFFHMPPGHRIGKNIAVGGYDENYGRYSPGDCFHPNGTSCLSADLAGEYEISLLNEPYSDASLFDADILLAANPDYPMYEGSSPYRWTPEDVDALLNFAQRGGGVLLLVNSFLSRPDFWEENFDHERVGLLFEKLGLRWDNNFMSDDSIIEPAVSGSYKIGYGQGGRVLNGALPDNIKPLITYNNNVYGFEAKIGKGKLVVLGDAGMISNGLLCFPGFDNAAFIHEVLEKLKPEWAKNAARSWDLGSYSTIGAVPSKNGLSEDVIRSLKPDGQWMVDHHYRHIIWEPETIRAMGDEVWDRLPVYVDGEGIKNLKLRWLAVDGNETAPKLDIGLKTETVRSGERTDIRITGRTCSKSLVWSDLCGRPELFVNSGDIEEVHSVFNMKLVLDAQGRKKCAKWNQGQILYARNKKALHYGYEIILCSRSYLIAPRATDVV